MLVVTHSAFSSARERGAADRDNDLGNIECYLQLSRRFIGPGKKYDIWLPPLLSYLSMESEAAASSVQRRASS